MDRPIPQEIYRHFKGNLYQILTLAEESETGETLVIYQALYGDYKVYARELSMFMSRVDKEKYPDAVQEMRFERVGGAAPQTEAAPPAADAAPELSQNVETAAPQGAKADAAPKPPQKAEAAAPQGAEADAAPEPPQTAELELDPKVIAFMDARSYEEKLDVLESLHNRITEQMLNAMVMSLDMEIREGSVEERYEELHKSLTLFQKFECSRLR